MDKQNTGQQGFTLIEIMISVTVFAIGILAVASMQVKAIKTDSQASRITEVATSVEETVERITALGYDNFFLSDTDGDGTNQDTNANGIDDDDEVADPPDPPENFGLNDTIQVNNSGPTPVIITTSDHTRTIGKYTVYWNIAVDQPTTGLKIIRTIIFWTEGGQQRRITLDSVKPVM